MLQAQAFFAERKARADMDGFDQLMQRNGGEPPRDGMPFESQQGLAALARPRQVSWTLRQPVGCAACLNTSVAHWFRLLPAACAAMSARP